MRDWPPICTPRHRRAVFVDQDGTINVDTHFPHRAEEIDFISRALEGLRLLATLPLDVIVVSNQAGIALGIFTREQMSQFNAELRSRVEGCGGRIDAFYYCPHLEPKHLAPGMLFEAAEDFSFDLSQSFMIGDKTSDIAAGRSAGCVTILVMTGKAG
jgi:histidinol-phosphate phosphatase family protein